MHVSEVQDAVNAARGVALGAGASKKANRPCGSRQRYPHRFQGADTRGHVELDDAVESIRRRVPGESAPVGRAQGRHLETAEGAVVGPAEVSSHVDRAVGDGHRLQCVTHLVDPEGLYRTGRCHRERHRCVATRWVVVTAGHHHGVRVVG